MRILIEKFYTTLLYSPLIIYNIKYVFWNNCPWHYDAIQLYNNSVILKSYYNFYDNLSS